jgi:hypothetical protein
MSTRYRYPDVSPSGRWVASGYGRIDVAGVDAGTGWGPKWLDDDRVVFNRGNALDHGGDAAAAGTWFASRAGGLLKAEATPYQELSAHEGTWVGCTPGIRLRLTTGEVLTGKYFQPCYYAGRLAVLFDRTVDERHPLTDLRLDGRTLVTGKLTQPSLSRTHVCWRQGFGQGWRTRIARQDGTGAQDITIGAVEHWAILIETAAGDVVLSHDGARTYVRRPGDAVGWMVTLGECFEPRGVWTPGGLVVAWMANGARHLRTLPLDDGSRVDLTPGTGPIVVPAPIVRIGRPLWCGWFTFAGHAGLPGNCDLAIRQDQARIVRTLDGRPIAVYVEGNPDGDIAALERAIRAAKDTHDLPVLAYWTKRAQAGRVPVGADLVGVEAYRGVTETVATFEARIRASVARCPAAVLIAQAYSSNAFNTKDLASVVPVVARIARDLRHVAGILAFSGSGRATGIQDHPAVLPLWRELADGIPRAPELPQPAPTPKPPTPKPEPEDDMPKMTFDESLAVVKAAAQKWRDIHVPHDNPHRHLLLDEGQAHIWAWRALAEGWSREQILEDVK